MKGLEKKMKELGLNPKKEWGMFFLINLLIIGLSAILYFFYRLPAFIFVPLVIIPIVDFIYLSRYGDLLKEKGERMNDQFVESFTYFEIYVGDGYNVYRALEETAALSKDEIKPAFESLLRGIDKDKSLRPFLNFAAKFPSLSVKEVMLSVFQMVEEGGGTTYLLAFQRLFDSFSEERHRLQVERHKKKLGGLNILPLIGSAITMLALTAALLSIIGGLMDVA